MTQTKRLNQTGIYKKVSPDPLTAALVIGILLRIIFFIYYQLNGDIYCDEAMTILNARSIAENGTNIFGERLPIYFDTWLYGGQSGFATYIIAFFIKIFGYSLTLSRIPILIFSILGLWAFYGLVKELLQNRKQAFFAITLASISPHFIYQSAWTLDCTFFPQLFIIALYFLCRALKSKRIWFYIISMVFFGLCLHAYIASVLIVPVFLAILFLILLCKKETNFKATVISFITIVLISLPIIIFGFVQMGFIGEVNLFGVSIDKMETYDRTSSFNVGFNISIKEFIFNYIYNIAYQFIHFFIPDTAIYRNLLGTAFEKISETNSVTQIIANIFTFEDSISIFDFGHFFSGILLFAGFIILFVNRKKIPKLAFYVIITFATCLFIYGVLVKLRCYTLYRFSVFYYLFYILCGIAATKIYDKIKLSKEIKQGFVAICLILSVMLTCYTYTNIYTKEDSDFFGNTLNDCVKYAQDNEVQSITFFNSNQAVTNEREAVYLLFYNYDSKEDFVSLEETLRNRGTVSDFDMSKAQPEKITEDGLWMYKTYCANAELTDDCYIFTSTTLSDEKAQEISGYSFKDFGYYAVLIRNE